MWIETNFTDLSVIETKIEKKIHFENIPLNMYINVYVTQY